MKPHTKQFFKFLEKKENKRAPLEVKLLNPKVFKIDPEDLDVKGNLDLNNLKIESLPDNLRVRGSLWLDDTPIKSLPNNLRVRGNLWLDSTPLAKNYTEGQIRSMVEEKGGYVKGKIYL